MKVKVEAKAFPDRIELTQNFEDPHLSGDPMVNMHREILKLKDAAVRDALISLGWTPPNDGIPPIKGPDSESKWISVPRELVPDVVEMVARHKRNIDNPQSKISSLEVDTTNRSINAVMSRFVDNGNGTLSYKRPEPYSGRSDGIKPTHRPKGSMCVNCKGLSSQYKHNCPSRDDFITMPKIGQDSDGMIVVKCSNFERV